MHIYYIIYIYIYYIYVGIYIYPKLVDSCIFNMFSPDAF